MEAICSPKNARVREWRKLRRPDVARARSQVLIEGAQAVLQALGTRQRLVALLLSRELAGPELAARVLRRAGYSAPLYELSAAAFASLSGRDGPSGVAAVLELHLGALAEVAPEPGDLVLALWRVENPGNLGTVVRTADALGARAVVLVDRCTNPYAPLAAKASMGAIFHLPLVACASLAELRAWCSHHHVALVGTSAHGTMLANGWRPQPPLALLFGPEGSGLTPEGRALCDHVVSIPMQGVNSSLNLAVAAGILAYLARANAGPSILAGGP